MHTPGPWRHATKSNFGNMVEAQSGKRTYEADDGWRGVAMVQHCCTGNYMDEAQNQAANIRLIAAAPDMLAALQQIVAGANNDENISNADFRMNACREAQSAIAKATGSP